MLLLIRHDWAFFISPVLSTCQLVSFLPTRALFIGSSCLLRQVFHWQQSSLCSQLPPAPYPMIIGSLEFPLCTHSYLAPLCFLSPRSVTLPSFYCNSLLPNYFGCSSDSKYQERSSHVFKINLKFGRKFIYSLLLRLHGKRPYTSLFIFVPDSHFLQFSGHVYIGHGVGKKG